MNPKVNNPLVQVTLEPMGVRIEVPAGLTLLECAHRAGIEINAVCGGNGTCGMCKVILMQGSFSPLETIEQDLLTPEEITRGWRLACQAQVWSDARLQFPPESLATLQRLQLEGLEMDVQPDLLVGWQDVDFPQGIPTDAAGVLAWLGQKSSSQIPPGLIPQAEQLLKCGQKRLRIAFNANQIISVLPAGSPLFGLAVDIGTTKVAAYLVDLHSGKTMASAGVTNPQIAYGEDVISRIEYSDNHPSGGAELQRVLVEALDELARELCRKAGVILEQVVEGVMVGNTAMHHLLVGHSVHSLGTAPYTAGILAAMEFPAAELGLHLAPGASIHLPPNIAGFVGGDHVAMLLATRAAELGQTVVALDIGTNTEISLVHRGRHLACSCASGPAFEGAHLREGMRAIPGAIERIRLDGDTVQVHTIQDQPAIGICGSGILDGVAELRRVGLVDSRGSFRKGDPRLTLQAGKPSFLLVPAGRSGHGREIRISREDVNEIQLAKAAIRSGVEILLREAGITSREIELFLVAGAFGTYLDLTSAVSIGLFPPIPLEIFRQVGNAAGAGARQMLISGQMREKAKHLGERIEYVELTTVPGYSDVFMDAIRLD